MMIRRLSRSGFVGKFVASRVDLLIELPRQGKRRCVMSSQEIRQRATEAFDHGVEPQDSIPEGIRGLGQKEERDRPSILPDFSSAESRDAYRD
jgi:hypothetical protein